MPEFKVKATYYGPDGRKIFFREKESVGYHCFSIRKSIDDFPGEFFPPSSVLRNKNEKGWRNSWDITIYCLLFIEENLAQKLNLNFEKDKNYQFVVRLGEPKAAKFITTEIKKEYEEHQLVLKTKWYFENTVQKIGFWGSEDYFYDPKKETKKPIPKSKSNSDQSENKNKWGKIFLFCLPIIILALLSFLIIRWVSKKRKKK